MVPWALPIVSETRTGTQLSWKLPNAATAQVLTGFLAEAGVAADYHVFKNLKSAVTIVYGPEQATNVAWAIHLFNNFLDTRERLEQQTYAGPTILPQS